MFDWYQVANKPAPASHEEAAELLQSGYGFAHERGDNARFVTTNDGTWELNHVVIGEYKDVQFDAFFLHTDALFTAMEVVAPLPEWTVIEEVGEPGNIPTYNGQCW